jgi:cystathionine beta-lyase
MALKALLQPGDTVAVQTPAYTPMLKAPGHWGLKRLDLPLILDGEGAAAFDADAFARGMAGTQALLLCHPHNPTGKVFERGELVAIAEACLASGALIISDEIHADILYDGRRHIPIAALDEAVARRTVTLMAASKAYNIAGLKTAFAIIRDPAMRAAFSAARLGMVDSVNALGLAATQAAYGSGAPWLAALKGYLQANRDHLAVRIARDLPGVRLIMPQGTFLAWLDCSATELADPQAYFLSEAKVGLNAGADFGPGAQAFVRLNFGCPRALLDEGLSRLQASLERR